ncbi:MAG: GNAT family N-acetyltransferase [Bacteroidetes bacterium]|nr:GNAT family N-acetyltransferase [Bacteroidota bacterium]
MLNFLELNETFKKQWCSFVEEHNYGNVFQTFEYYELFLNEKNYKPFAFAVIDYNEIVAIIAGVIETNLFPPVDILTSRAVIRGGPLIINNSRKILDYLLSNLITKLKSECIYIQFRNLWNFNSEKDVFNKYNFRYVTHLAILNRLDQPRELLIKKINKNKRGNINKSLNKGIVFKEINDVDEFSKCIGLINQTYSRVKLPVPNKKFFSKAFDKLHSIGLLKVFGAYDNLILIGTRLELCYKHRIYDWYAGSDDNYKNRYPNDFLPYHIFLWGQEHNFNVFDFGGAGKPNIPYGVRDHKIKFGGDLVEFGRFERILKPTLMKIGRLGLKIYKLFR